MHISSNCATITIQHESATRVPNFEAGGPNLLYREFGSSINTCILMKLLLMGLVDFDKNKMNLWLLGQDVLNLTGKY